MNDNYQLQNITFKYGSTEVFVIPLKIESVQSITNNKERKKYNQIHKFSHRVDSSYSVSWNDKDNCWTVMCKYDNRMFIINTPSIKGEHEPTLTLSVLKLSLKFLTYEIIDYEELGINEYKVKFVVKSKV